MSRAIYLDLPGGLVALVSPDVHPGPLHLMLDDDVPRCDSGTPATTVLGEVLVASVSIDLRAAAMWEGVLPPPALVRAQASLLCEALEVAAGGSSLLAMGGRASEGLERLRAGDLAGTAAVLGGLGPGLTPAGDDALAGAMFGFRVAFGRAVEPILARVTGTLATGRISLAFLVWAMRGQSLAPVHDLLAAAVQEDREEAAAAVRALAAIGASSGGDFALGLRSVLTLIADSQRLGEPSDGGHELLELRG